MRILYCPIFVKGTYYETQRRTKHGLRDALALQGECRELDYLNALNVGDALRAELDSLRPELLFLQMQGTTPITPTLLADLRAEYPALTVVNWNGDYYPEHLISPDMLDLLRHVDLQLTVNASVLFAYAEAGIHAKYCPFGYEAPISPLPETKAHELVFLGNNYSEKRKALYDVLRFIRHDVGIYGSGWEWSDGECNYDFAYSQALYQRALIAISDNQFPDALGYLSDRPFQVLAANGAILFQQRVLGLEALTGLKAGVHYVEFVELDDLYGLVKYWVKPSQRPERERMAAAGRNLVQARHLWRHRVETLVQSWLPEVVGERA
jgi:hypothetical protein